MSAIILVGLGELMVILGEFKLLKRRLKIAFENVDSSSIVELLPSKIKYANKQTSSLKPYVPNVILEKIIIDLEDEAVNLLEKEKANLETIDSLKSKGVESSETIISESENQSENDCLVVEKECDKEENSKQIAPGMFKLSVSHSISPISMSKSSCESNNVEIKLKRKRHLDTFSSVRRPKNSGVVWKKKGSSNTSKVDLSAVRISNFKKNVKRYSRKDLLACNNSHLGETRSVFVCNDAMNVSCDSRMNDLLDDNNFFIFDYECVRISPVRKMLFRKKPRDYMNVRSKSNSNKSLPRTIVQICLWIIDSRCSKHVTGNHALLTNFVDKFLGTVRFGNNDFAMIAGYGDVVIGLPKMNFEKDHLCSACEQGKIHRNHHKSKMAFASNKPLYLLHMHLCGPMRIQSTNGKRFVLVVFDDYSRYTWMNENKGIMSTKVELTLEQSQEGVSDDVLLTKAEGNDGIIMVNIIPPDHVDEVHVVEPNQHDDVLVVPEPILVDEDEDPEEDEFDEEEDPQEEKDDMEIDIDIEEDEN
uniref:Spindle assembly checkpoint component MAD1-like n=1 Tax=Tanacetum cinerariifolium TaxID=118510 RepID=A0A699GNX3_TANCI|nr:spindle assembly checkpoint component MAD1-like [Tanacetum cinerariifolium]